MPCCTVANGITVCVPTGKWELVKERRPRKRWCFACRKRTLYRFWLFMPGPESWYGPDPAWRCDQCHGENDLFPGMRREWGEP